MQKSYNQQQSEFLLEYEEIKRDLANLTTVSEYNINPKFSFAVTFAQLFMCDLPNYKLTDENYGATRSSWTYHTAITMAQACKMFELDCKFEANGRRDAVIETRDDPPKDFLFAEWEWDYQDIFGEGKELEKLSKSCRTSKTADAFLLTYCPKNKYVEFLKKVSIYWLKAFGKIKVPPTLFLYVIVFEEKGKTRLFEKLKTVEIHPSIIIVWTDKYF